MMSEAFEAKFWSYLGGGDHSCTLEFMVRLKMGPIFDLNYEYKRLDNIYRIGYSISEYTRYSLRVFINFTVYPVHLCITSEPH